jgi:hypothetical protein
MQYVMLLVCNWSYSLFYIVSELWGSVGVSVLFWQLANDITPVAQAKRFYPLFGQLANIAPICAGQTVAYFAKMSSEGDEAFGTALKVPFVTYIYTHAFAQYNRPQNSCAPMLNKLCCVVHPPRICAYYASACIYAGTKSWQSKSQRASHRTCTKSHTISMFSHSL